MIPCVNHANNCVKYDFNKKLSAIMLYLTMNCYGYN